MNATAVNIHDNPESPSLPLTITESLTAQQPSILTQSSDASQVGGEVTQNDERVAAIQRMCDSVTKVVQGELDATSAEYDLLADLNNRAALEYKNFADFAQGLAVFVDRLQTKSRQLQECLEQIEEIDHQVTDLEAIVSSLDRVTINLEANLRAGLTS